MERGQMMMHPRKEKIIDRTVQGRVGERVCMCVYILKRNKVNEGRIRNRTMKNEY